MRILRVLKFHLKSFFSDESGQTSVEYIMLVAVMSVIIVSILKTFGHLLGTEGLIGKIASSFTGLSDSGFKRFKLMR